jgi:hypothetical protein
MNSTTIRSNARIEADSARGQVPLTSALWASYKDLKDNHGLQNY